MAVQARHLSHNLALPPAVGGSLFLDEYAAGCVPAPARAGDAATVLGDFPRSDLAWCNYGVLPRKRPRLEAGQAPPPAAGGFLDDQRVGMAPAGTECLLPVPPAFIGDVRSRAVGSGAASTSGRVANGATVSRGRGPLLSSWTHLHGVEVDALVRLEAERMRAALEEARRRHARALMAAVGRAASGRLRASETDLARALRRNAELEEKARQAAAECQAWIGVARSHEAVAAGLRAALDKLLRLPCGAAVGGATGGGCEGGDAEDAQSCCFEAPATARADQSSGSMPASCRSCGGEACVVLLPCRHLCLCRACEAAVDACPVCAAAKNGSLHVLFS